MLIKSRIRFKKNMKNDTNLLKKISIIIALYGTENKIIKCRLFG